MNLVLSTSHSQNQQQKRSQKGFGLESANDFNVNIVIEILWYFAQTQTAQTIMRNWFKNISHVYTFSQNPWAGQQDKRTPSAAVLSSVGSPACGMGPWSDVSAKCGKTSKPFEYRCMSTNPWMYWKTYPRPDEAKNESNCTTRKKRNKYVRNTFVPCRSTPPAREQASF